MAIQQTITDEYHFWDWLRNSDSYSKNFSFEGANAVQDYYDQLSDDLGEDIEFDPIAWCCEWAEYDSVKEAYKELHGDESDLPREQRRTQKAQQLEWFEDNTTVIELDNGHVLIQEF